MARGTLVSERGSVAEDPLVVFEYVERQGWGDGLPVIPPTEERVQAMLDASPLPPAHVVAVVEPRRGEATVEKIAVNAVLAGCPPAAFPALLAAVEAVTEPQFNLYAINTTTCCATPALMLNGPARQALGIECGYSCLGQNGRANATDHEKAAAFDTYTAYYGTYTFEPGNGIVIHHLEGSLSPGQIGQDNIRYFELKGNRLTLSVANDGKGGRLARKDTTAHLTWEKIPAK